MIFSATRFNVNSLLSPIDSAGSPSEFDVARSALAIGCCDDEVTSTPFVSATSIGFGVSKDLMKND